MTGELTEEQIKGAIEREKVYEEYNKKYPIEERCPDANRKQFYPYEMCNLNDKMCVRESGWDCPYYNEYLEELQKEEDEEKELLSYWGD